MTGKTANKREKDSSDISVVSDTESEEKERRPKPLSPRGTLNRWKQIQRDAGRLKDVESGPQEHEIQASLESMAVINTEIRGMIADIHVFRDRVLHECIERVDRTNEGLADSSMAQHRLTPFSAEKAIETIKIQKARRQALESS